MYILSNRAGCSPDSHGCQLVDDKKTSNKAQSATAVVKN